MKENLSAEVFCTHIQFSALLQKLLDAKPQPLKKIIVWGVMAGGYQKSQCSTFLMHILHLAKNSIILWLSQKSFFWWLDTLKWSVILCIAPSRGRLLVTYTPPHKLPCYLWECTYSAISLSCYPFVPQKIFLKLPGKLPQFHQTREEKLVTQLSSILEHYSTHQIATSIINWILAQHLNGKNLPQRITIPAKPLQVGKIIQGSTPQYHPASSMIYSP